MELIKYRYKLDTGSKKFRCPACQKKRFVRYLDDETGNYLADDVGRCDRIESCGYHLPPREAGLDNNRALYSIPEPLSEPVPCYLPFEYVERSEGNYERNTLISWMATLRGWDQIRAETVAKNYHVGTGSKKEVNGWAIYWQIDENNKVRSGKMMKYQNDGHRSKDKYSNDTVQSILKRSGQLNDFELVKCFFGLHIIDKSKPVAICESEKTAIIASQYLPQFHWIASGQLQGINEYKLRPLKGMKVVLFPDIGAFDLWNDKALEFGHIADIKVSTLLETKAPDQHKGYDIADYLIQYDLRDFSPHGWNQWTGEIFDERGYPKDWDEVEIPETFTNEFIEMQRYEMDI